MIKKLNDNISQEARFKKILYINLERRAEKDLKNFSTGDRMRFWKESFFYCYKRTVKMNTKILVCTRMYVYSTHKLY